MVAADTHTDPVLRITSIRKYDIAVFVINLNARQLEKPLAAPMQNGMPHTVHIMATASGFVRLFSGRCRGRKPRQPISEPILPSMPVMVPATSENVMFNKKQ